MTRLFLTLAFAAACLVTYWIAIKLDPPSSAWVALQKLEWNRSTDKESK